MLTRLRLYREYRRQGLRQAWHYSGMDSVMLSSAKYIAACILAIALALFASHEAEAINVAADSRVAARLANQVAEISALRRIVATCLGDKEGALFIGGELHMCWAAPTGIREKK